MNALILNGDMSRPQATLLSMTYSVSSGRERPSEGAQKNKAQREEEAAKMLDRVFRSEMVGFHHGGLNE